jgi:hypothetical protein
MARTATEIGQATTGTASNFKIVSGIAKPLDLATLGRFQGVQRAINTTLAMLRGKIAGVPANIATDGELGQKTLAAAQFVARTLGAKAPELPSFASSINNLAINAAVFTQRLGALSGFTPSTAPDPARAATKPATGTTPSPGTPAQSIPGITPAPGALVPVSTLPQPLAPPSSPSSTKKIHWAWFVVGGLALVGGVALIFKFSKSNGKKKKDLSDSDGDDYDAEDFGYGPASNDFIDV